MGGIVSNPFSKSKKGAGSPGMLYIDTLFRL